jgi:O-antigen ligase
VIIAGSGTQWSPGRVFIRSAFWVGFCGLCYGALAFGAVYAWGYWSLAAFSVVSGGAGLLACPTIRRGFPNLRMVAALSLLACAIATQLIPLPQQLLDIVSKNTLPAVRQIDLLASIDLTRWHPLSVVPTQTIVALALFLSFLTFLFGFTRILSITGAAMFADSVALAGGALALFGILQGITTDNEKIYGFWQPSLAGHVGAGPFVNKNHFAGWMLLAIPLVLARLVSGIENSMAGIKPGWRNRVLWLSSSEASRLILLGAAALLMALSLALTTSRSGVIAFALSMIVSGKFIISGSARRTRKALGLCSLILLGVIVPVAAGYDAVVTTFARTDWAEFNNRRGAWIDAWSIAEKFPITGTGLNSYGTANLFYQRHDLDRSYSEAHNDYLQLLAEGGTLLFVPFCLCIVAFIGAVRRRFSESSPPTARWLRMGAMTGLIAIALQETVEFSLQIPANAMLFAAICAVALHESAPPSRSGGYGCQVHQNPHRFQRLPNEQPL